MRRSSSRQRKGGTDDHSEQSKIFELGGAAASKNLYERYKDSDAGDDASSSYDGAPSSSSKGRKDAGPLVLRARRMWHAVWHNRRNRHLLLGLLTLLALTIEISRRRTAAGSPAKKKKRPSFMRKRWNPCPDTMYAWERHDHEPRYGDVCRAKGREKQKFQCPDGCKATGGEAPFCVNVDAGEETKKTNGEAGGPCRVRNPAAPAEYRCDYGGVCIHAVGTPREQFRGDGRFHTSDCDNTCGDGRKGDLTGWVHIAKMCTSDMDCSLSGVCNDDGKCDCDPWAEGVDCSYLKFTPVDRSRLGYLHEKHSSWGGSVVRGKAGGYRMYVSENACEDGGARCGWKDRETMTRSRISLATSSNVDGPYERSEGGSDIEGRNPSVHVSPKTGDWHLYSEPGPKGGSSQRMISKDEGASWEHPTTVSPRKNPGPLLKEDGSTVLFYAAEGLDLPPPTCSNHGISVTQCPADVDEQCKSPSDDNPVFGHAGDDPHVFRDHRGNHHMLFNALPYRCQPKFEGGGHAWSEDGGATWSTPRVGAFDSTVKFTDGTEMRCERRERPQMIVGEDGRPVAMVSAVSGCPEGLGGLEMNDSGRFYKGGDDSFTLVQKMGAAV